jgi:hypothetical protein
MVTLGWGIGIDTGDWGRQRIRGVAARVYRLKTGHAVTHHYVEWIKKQEDGRYCWQTRDHILKTCAV